MAHRYVLVASLCILLGSVCGQDQVEPNLFSHGSTSFAVDLLKVLSKSSDGNVLISPIGIDVLLSVLQQGASGETSQQLDNVLRRNAAVSRDGHKSLQGLGADNVELAIATKMYLKPDVEVSADFKVTANDDFRTAFENLDFLKPESAAIINDWISNATGGHIQNLISQDALTADTAMVLVSGVFFKGKWKTPFTRGRGAVSKFKSSADVTVEVPFMNLADKFNAGRDTSLGLKWVEIPYKGGDFSMMLVLPLKDHDLANVIEKFDENTLQSLLKKGSEVHVKLRVPRFEIDVKTALVETLQSIGLVDVFSNSADFSGMSDTPVAISNVVQQAKLIVNEEGSEASAATGIVFTTLSLPWHPDQMTFNANQPFLAIIVNKEKGIPLFVAKVVNPA